MDDSEDTRVGTLAEDQLQRFARELRSLHISERKRTSELEEQEKTIKRLLEQELVTIKELRSAYVEEKNRRIALESTYMSTVRMLASAVEARDRYTGGHVMRVAKFCASMGKRMQLDAQSLKDLDFAATLHDLGKIGIPDSILNSTAALSSDQMDLMREHPAIGAALLREVPALERASRVVLAHHERWDGSGYPNGLEGDAIPLLSRIISVADALDAITSTRSYRVAKDGKSAIAEIKRLAGCHFDPDVVSVLVTWYEEEDLEFR